jgi:YidC/Oxa1 family membrane protein insertase
MGFLNPLYEAVAWVMAKIHAGLSLFLPSTSGQAWFLTIVLLVVLMRLVLVPLFIKQMHAMRKMSALAPQMQELRKKYKNDKQTLNEETMKLYREAGVNPLGGCLPLVAQLPIFFALFNVLRGIAGWHPGLPLPYGLTESVVRSAQNANILGAKIGDKVLFTHGMYVPLHAKIVILCFVAISVATTFMTVRQSTKRGMTPQMTPDNPMAASQKYMAYIVPFFALSGLYWAFGLVMYWVTTNVWTLGQQYVLFKRYPPTAPDAAGAGSAPAAPGKPATAAGLVAGKKPPASRSAADAVKRPAPAKPPASKPAAEAAKQRRAAYSEAARREAADVDRQSAKPPTAAKPAGAKPPASTKPGTAAKSAPARPPAAKPAPGKPAAAKPSASPGQSAGKKAAAGGAQRQDRPAGQETSTNGAGSVSGLLRRFGRGRPETEEQQPQEPEVKLVRQQRVRQSRRKRSGKR